MRRLRLVLVLIRPIAALGFNDPPSRMPGRRRRPGGGGPCPRDGCGGSLRRNGDGTYSCTRCGFQTSRPNR
ncbi:MULTISPECIES: hypothetical protein [Amycolatopsis]|nr:hypothetical protein [Amycolatopsis bullii]